MDKAIGPTVTKQRQRRRHPLTAIDLPKWLKAPRKQQERADGSHQTLLVPPVFERAIPRSEQEHHGPGGIGKWNGRTTKARRGGAQD
jgi:hypothetical protein